LQRDEPLDQPLEALSVFWRSRREEKISHRQVFNLPKEDFSCCGKGHKTCWMKIRLKIVLWKFLPTDRSVFVTLAGLTLPEATRDNNQICGIFFSVYKGPPKLY
jgi:hypothetical protein